MVGPVFEVGKLWGLGGGGGEAFVASGAVEVGGEFFAASGVAGREFGGIGSVFSGGGFGEVGGEGGGFFIGEAEVGHLDGLVMLLRVFEEGGEGAVFEFGGDVVEGDAAVFEVWFVGIGLGVAGDAAEFMEVFAAFLGEGEVGFGADCFVGFKSGEVGTEVGGGLGALGFGVIDHGGHGGGGFEEIRLGDPAGEPGFVGAVADVAEIGAGV